MINRILVFILCQLFKINPRMLNFRNWRRAEPYELISRVLNFCPPLFDSTGNEYGLYIMYNGRIWYLSEQHKYFDLTDTDVSIDLLSLFAKHFKDNRKIIVRHVPTVLMKYFLVRNIKKQIKKQSNEKNDSKTVYDVSPVQFAIREDGKWSRHQAYDRKKVFI